MTSRTVAYPLRGSSPDAHDSAFAALVKESGLTAREAELAALACRNYSAKRIGSDLFIAESTVYSHLKRIYKKTGVHSKRELMELVEERAQMLDPR